MTQPTTDTRCGCCGRLFPIEQLDIVDNGYRCARCAEADGVTRQIEAAAEEQRERGREEGWLRGFLFGVWGRKWWTR